MEVLNTFTIDQSFVAVIFTTVAAIATFYVERRKKRVIPPTIETKNVELVDRVFGEMQTMITITNDQRDRLSDQLVDCKSEVDSYRNKYHDQVEINAIQSAKVTKMHLDLFTLLPNVTGSGEVDN
jgi:hypothetical protein